MAFRHGRKAEAYLDANDISTYLNDLGLSVTVADAPTTTFKGTWESSLTGLANVTVNAGGYYDPTTGGPYGAIRAVLQQATDSILTVAPAGMQTIGDFTRLVAVDSTAFKEGAKVGGAVSFTWDVKSDGQVGFGYILHPLATDNGTTTGAFRDDLAATTKGGVMHLHISAVSSGSWVIKLQDCATSGGAYVDVAGATFAAATSAGAQRLVVPGTIRQFVKYVATVTGGSTPTITFALALART